MFSNTVKNQNESTAQVKSLIFTGEPQQCYPVKYKVVIEYKNGTKTEPCFMDAYTLYDHYGAFLPKEYFDEISDAVNRMRAKRP